jgi:hypothetical protein
MKHGPVAIAIVMINNFIRDCMSRTAGAGVDDLMSSDAAIRRGTMMLRSSAYPPIAWCCLAYLFLSQGNPTGAILGAMGSITTAWFVQQADLA